MTTQLRFRPGRRRGRAVPRDPAEGERASTLFNSAHDADDVPQRLLTPGRCWACWCWRPVWRGWSRTRAGGGRRARRRRDREPRRPGRL